MKKVISIILVVSLLLSLGTVVYANETSSGVASSRITKEDLKEMFVKLGENKDSILILRAQLKDAIKELKAKINEIKENKDNLTPEQILAIKEARDLIKSKRQEFIGNHKGKIAKELRPNLNSAKKLRNYGEIEAIYNNMITAQEERIDFLNAAINAVKEALST